MRTLIQCFSLAALVAMAASGSALAASSTPVFPRGGVFIGSFTVLDITDPVNGSDDTNAFDSIEGRSVGFKASFDAIESDNYTIEGDGSRKRILTTSSALISFSGEHAAYLRTIVAPTLNSAIRITIREDVDGNSFVEGFQIGLHQMPAYFGFQCQGPVALAVSTRAPRVQRVDLDPTPMSLERFDGVTGLTDLATGVVRFSVVDNIPVAVELRTFSHVKAMYGAVQQ